MDGSGGVQVTDEEEDLSPLAGPCLYDPCEAVVLGAAPRLPLHSLRQTRLHPKPCKGTPV